MNRNTRPPSSSVPTRPRIRRALDGGVYEIEGVRFQYRMGSALLGGVGEDAEHVVAAIAGRASGNRGTCR